MTNVISALALTILTSFSKAFPEEAPEKPFLHQLFTDDMVLQRDAECPVWGWTEAGKEVTVTLNDKSATATGGEDGKWLAKLPALPAGGPYELAVTGPQQVTLKNVMLGDVWLCSGQSNMEWGMWGTNNSKEEVAAANHPDIRLYTVLKKTANTPQELVAGKWSVCGPQTVGSFSAVGFFFGRHLHQEIKVPIGLINSSWGGTICEAWTSAEALDTMPDFQPAVALLRLTAADPDKAASDFEAQMKEWWTKNDPGSAEGQNWESPTFSAATWKTMKLPGNWEAADLKGFDGLVWFRKEIELPEAWAGKDLTLSLGPIDDRDTTWFNGEQVGAMNVWRDPRNYKVPGRLVKAGKNVIAIRVLDTGGGGGLFGKPEDLKLTLAGDAAAEPVALAGDWLFKDSAALANLSAAPQQIGQGPNFPTMLYNGMIAPLLPSAIKGAIWYQGESNAWRGLQYRTLLPTMIKDWRNRFSAGEFPFFVVQLANFMAVDQEPKNDSWPNLREAQLMTSQNDPNVGLAVIIDIGEEKDIHPKNKQDVGLRLALAARAIAYKQDLVYSGPIYKSMKVEGGKIRLAFDHVGGGLIAKDEDKLKGFAIAGEDLNFVWADAEIDGETVIVSSPQIEKPAHVRYAWSNNPVCNLYNKEGLPASPFRTDQ